MALININVLFNVGMNKMQYQLNVRLCYPHKCEPFEHSFHYIVKHFMCPYQIPNQTAPFNKCKGE